MKRVYFVRHGQSTSNVEQIVQGLDDPLTELGEQQALRVAERAMDLPVSTFFSSDAIRAKQTAEIISSAIKLPVQYSELFREVRRPTSLIGIQRSTETYKQFLETERAHLGEPGWHFEDEENYDDLRTRADAAWKLLKENEGEDILVVTHGYFLRFMVSLVLTGGTLTPDVWKQISVAMTEANTGITVCIHNGERWRLVTWNDFAHFAEGD